MADLKDVIACIYNNYPEKHKLSNDRLEKMLYLADWRSAITNKRQITNIVWRFGKNGPEFEEDKEQVRVPNEGKPYSLEDLTYFSVTSEDKAVIEHVIKITYQKGWDELTSLVYSTFPILNQPRFLK